MSDETRPEDTDPDTQPDTSGEQNTPPDDVSAGQDGEQPDTDQDTPEDTDPAALDADDDPDSLVGDLTEPDIDLDHLDVVPDDDGGDES